MELMLAAMASLMRFGYGDQTRIEGEVDSTGIWQRKERKTNETGRLAVEAGREWRTAQCAGASFRTWLPWRLRI